MKPLQAFYNGVTFKSRTEARHAHFFDLLNEPWEYEKEGFDLGGGDWYVPDFYLSRLETWVEIKGEKPNAREIRVARKLNFETICDVAIFHGRPMENPGLLFGYSENRGGMLIETPAQWHWSGQLELTDFFADEPTGKLAEAAERAKKYQFDYGREQVNTVRYEHLPF